MALLIAPLFTAGITIGSLPQSYAIPMPEDLIDVLIFQVNNLNDDDLNNGNINSLNKKLENAIKIMVASL